MAGPDATTAFVRMMFGLTDEQRAEAFRSQYLSSSDSAITAEIEPIVDAAELLETDPASGVWDGLPPMLAEAFSEGNRLHRDMAITVWNTWVAVVDEMRAAGVPSGGGRGAGSASGTSGAGSSGGGSARTGRSGSGSSGSGRSGSASSGAHSAGRGAQRSPSPAGAATTGSTGPSGSSGHCPTCGVPSNGRCNRCENDEILRDHVEYDRRLYEIEREHVEYNRLQDDLRDLDTSPVYTPPAYEPPAYEPSYDTYSSTSYSDTSYSDSSYSSSSYSGDDGY